MVAPIFGIHDAATGFHDVKPLPQFAPIDWWFVFIIGALFALFIAAILYRRHQKMKPPPPPIPPQLEAAQNLQMLRERAASNQIALRELSTEASVIMRTYLEKKLKFPATDETTNEILRRLKTLLQAYSEQPTQSPLLPKTTESLRFLDYLTFSDDSEKRFDVTHRDVLGQLDTLSAIVSEYEQTLAEPEGAS